MVKIANTKVKESNNLTRNTTPGDINTGLDPEI